jgi:hypothetical protein
MNKTLLFAPIFLIVLASHAGAAIAIDPNSSSILYCASVRAYFLRSDDGGQTWAVKSRGVPLVDVNSILAIGSPTILYAATSAGIYRSRDRGETWAAASSGLSDLRVSVVTGSPAQSFIFATTAVGVYRSSDQGDTWTAAGALPAPPDITVPDPRSPSIVYAGVSNSLYRSFDLGTTWTKTGAALPIDTSARITAIAIDPNDSTTLLITEQSTFLDTPHKILVNTFELFISRDSGNTVSKLSTPFDGTDETVAFDRASVAYIGSIFRAAVSTNYGRFWSVAAGVSADRFASSTIADRVLA